MIKNPIANSANISASNSLSNNSNKDSNCCEITYPKKAASHSLFDKTIALGHAVKLIVILISVFSVNTLSEVNGHQNSNPSTLLNAPIQPTAKPKIEHYKNTPFVQLDYRIVNVKPHDSQVFTQGLVAHEGTLYESSGLYGRSNIRQYTITNNALIAQRDIASDLFAEGLTKVQDRLYLLTWRAQQLQIRSAADLSLLDTLTYKGQGWGLTHNNTQFIMSDGSPVIQFRDMTTFELESSLNIQYKGLTTPMLNELEFAQEAIWANVWKKPYILKIDPEVGSILGILDLSELVKVNSRITGHTVLNGIAYDKANGTFWVTGKLWPNRYEIEIFVPEPK